MQMEQHEPEMFHMRTVTSLFDTTPNNCCVHYHLQPFHFVFKELDAKEHINLCTSCMFGTLSLC